METYDTSYGDVHTFMRAPQGEPDSLSGDVDVGFVGVPFDGGVTREPGARHGPSAVREASGWHGRRFHSDRESVSLPSERTSSYGGVALRDCGDAPIVPNDIVETGKKVTNYVESVAQGTMPVVIGGDHYITYPAFVGYANTVGDDVGLIHLDAHSDTSDDSDLYGEHYHGSPMARIDEAEHGSYHGGITSTDLLRAVDLLGQCDAIGAADMMEVAPRLDSSNTTSLLASNAVGRFLEAKFAEPAG